MIVVLIFSEPKYIKECFYNGNFTEITFKSFAHGLSQGQRI